MGLNKKEWVGMLLVLGITFFLFWIGMELTDYGGTRHNGSKGSSEYSQQSK